MGSPSFRDSRSAGTRIGVFFFYALSSLTLCVLDIYRCCGYFPFILGENLNILARIRNAKHSGRSGQTRVQPRVRSERVGSPSSERVGDRGGDGFPGRRGGVFVRGCGHHSQECNNWLSYGRHVQPKEGQLGGQKPKTIPPISLIMRYSHPTCIFLISAFSFLLRLKSGDCTKFIHCI